MRMARYGLGYLIGMATKKPPPPPVVVEPRPDGQWAVQRDRGQRASSVNDTQAQAERKARTIAQNQGAELVVKGRDGRIQRKDSHGRDPRSSKG
jgi:hypothetical protein